MLKPFGIRNIGNTCFSNSVLQIFLNSKNLIKKMIILSKEKKNDNIVHFLHTIYCINDKNFGEIFVQNYRTLLEKVMSKDKYSFGRQGDAHEFFLNLIDYISNNDKFYSDYFEKKFSIDYETLIKCDECETIKKKKENMLIMNLDIGNGESKLSALISNFFNEVEHVERFFCDKCNKMVNIKKKMFVNKLPRYLVITLKK